MYEKKVAEELLKKEAAETMANQNSNNIKDEKESVEVFTQAVSQGPGKKRGRSKKVEQMKKKQRRRTRKIKSDGIVKLDTYFEKKTINF